MARRLRITVSVFFGLLTLALLMLWVRSYFVSQWAFVQVSQSHWLGPQLLRGQLILEGRDASTIPAYGPWAWLKFGRTTPKNFAPLQTSFLGFGKIGTPRGAAFVIPLWFPTLLAALLALLPRLSWRFSLRTLLIVTSIVAATLAFAVRAGH